MTKRLFALLLVLSIIFVFTSCGKSETSSTANSNTSEKTSETTSEESSFNIVDGVCYGEGLTFAIPEGYELYSETKGEVYFTDNINSFVFSVSVADTVLTADKLTEKVIVELYSDLMGDTKVISFETVTIKDTKGVYFVYGTTNGDTASQGDVSDEISEGNVSDAISDSDISDISTSESSIIEEEISKEPDVVSSYLIYHYTVIYKSKIIDIVFYTTGLDIKDDIKEVIDSVVFE